MLYFNHPEPPATTQPKLSLAAGLELARANREQRLEDLRVDLYDMERGGINVPLSATQLLLLEDEGYIFNFVTGCVERQGG